MCLTEITCRFDMNKGIKIKYFQVSYINDLAETQEARQDPHPPPPAPPPRTPKQRTTCGGTLDIYKVSVLAS